MSFLSSEDDVIKVKVVVIGDMAVGKTSLTVKYTKDSFENKHQQTVGASFFVRCIDLDNKKIIFQIWDTAGQERFRSLVPMYLRDAEVAIVMYDITSMSSFENLPFWLRDLMASAPINIKTVIVGNKVDKSDDRQVTYEVGKSFAAKKNMFFVETSAKTGHNIDALFLELGKQILIETDDDPTIQHTLEKNLWLATDEENNTVTKNTRGCCKS